MAGLLGKSSKPISNVTPAVGSVNIQQSTYGLTIPIVWGRTRVTGNLIWYGDFVATPHTEVTQSGGKGGAGGVAQSTTTYTYQAAVMMALAEGPILGIRGAWKGKSVYGGAVVLTKATKYVDTTTFGGFPITVAHTIGFADVSVEWESLTDWEPNGTWTPLLRGVDYTVTSGGVYTITSGAVPLLVNMRLTYTSTSTASNVSALGELGLDLAKGLPAQSAWSYLTTAHPSEAVGYSSIAYVYASNYALTGNAEVDNHAFEVDASLQFSSTIPDANPAAVLIDFLSNPQYGAGFGREKVAATTDYADACTAQGIFVSPALTQQAPAVDFVQNMADLTNMGVVWSEGLLKFIPRTDTAITGNGVTYTPNTTPIYDLTDDDFMGDPGDGPVVITRKSHADTYNTVKVEYLDRDHAYNISIVEAKDQADIQDSGVRAMSTVQAHWICDKTVARTVAQLILQRALFIRNTYEFTLGWNKIGLEPMDLVTITDSGMGLVKQPVRIMTIDESNTGLLSITAEEFPKGSASATLYPSTSGSGFAHDYNEAPGDAYAPTVFEAPAPMASSADGLEVWLATGGGASFGGCEVWTSLTGTNYERAAVMQGKSRYGVTTGTLSARSPAGVYSESVGISLTAGGQIIAGTSADLTSFATLCYVGGEFIAYQAATLTGAGAYTLGPSLNRGGYHSDPSAHASGVPFVRCDEALAKLPLTADYIGKTIHIKLLAFNVYKGATQSLADVTDYTYTITGIQANVAPPAPANLALEGAFTINTAKFKWDASARAGTYNVQVWAGGTLAKVREVNVGDALRYDYSYADAKTDGGPWRALTFKVQGVNINGAAGAFSVLAVTNPQVGGLTGASVTGGPGTVVFKCDRPADADFSAIKVWIDTSSGFTPGASNLVYDGPSTTLTIAALVGGSPLAASTNYYVQFAGYDNFDQAGLTISQLGPVTTSGASVQTGTAFVYQWGASAPALPTGTTTYTWATASNASYTTGDGWAVAVPTNPGTASLKLWQASIGISAAAGTSSSSVSYSGATIAAIAQNGATGGSGSPGADGTQSALARAYQWGLSAPTATGSTSWTWATSSYGAAPSGWSISVPSSPGAGYKLYEAVVTVTASATATTTSFNWSSASIAAISYNGTNGLPGGTGAPGNDGLSAAIGYSLVDAANTPLATSPSTSTVTGTAYPTTGTWGETRAWQSTSPTPSAGQSVYQIDGIYDPTVPQTVWAVPYLSALKVGSLSAISVNAGTITAGTFQTAASGAMVKLSSSTNKLQALDSSGNVVAEIGGTSNGSVYATSASSVYPVTIYGKHTGGYVGLSGETSGAPGAIGAGVYGKSSHASSYGGYFFNTDTSGTALYATTTGSGSTALYLHGRLTTAALSGGDGTTTTNSVVPLSDNTYTCGFTGAAWSDMYTVNAVHVTSDARRKTDIAPTDLGLNLVRLIPWKKWKWIEGEKQVIMIAGPDIPVGDINTGLLDEDGHPIMRDGGTAPGPDVASLVGVPGVRDHYGPLAQDVRAALEQLGATNTAIWSLVDKNNPDSGQMLRMGELIGIMGRAIQEIDDRLVAAGI